MARRPPSMSALFGLAFAAGGVRSGLSRLGDNSFFWHLRTGRYILDHGIPRHDLYSFSAPHATWVAQSWLAELVYGGLDRAFGAFGVRVLGAATGAAVAAGTYALAHRLAGDRVRAALVAFAAVAASFTLWSERPLFLGILAFVAVLWLVEVPSSWIGRRPLVVLPAVMWLWANVHGTFSLGFVYLALHAVGRWLDGAPPWAGRERTLVVASVVAFAVCFVNPYGPALVLFPVRLLGRGSILRTVVEWRSPDLRTVQGLVFAAWMVVFVAVLARAAERPSRRDLVVALPFVALAWWAQRNIAVAPLVGLPVVARAVARPARDDARPALHWAIAGVLVALMGLWAVDAAATGDFDTRAYPVAALRAVEARGYLGRRLLTDDAWAGYVILKYGPARQRVFVDDRFDMYPLPVLHEFLDLSDGRPSWSRILERRHIEVIVWDTGAPLATFLRADARWLLVHRDRKASVFVHR